MLNQQAEPYSTVLKGLFTSNISSHPHPQLHITFFKVRCQRAERVGKKKGRTNKRK